jgi:hypothetical protein
MLNRCLVETGSTHLVHGLSLYIRGTKGYDTITDTGLQYLQSNRGGRYLLVGSRPWTHARCSGKGRVMRIDQDGVCSDVGRLGWHGKVAGVVPCCLAWSKPT